MEKSPSAIKSAYQTLLEQSASQHSLRRPMTTDDVARAVASSLNLEGFETSAADLKAHQTRAEESLLPESGT